MQREALISKTSAGLEAEGFSHCECLSTQSCFDIAASRDFLMLVKVLENIDGLTAQQAESLRRASSFLSAQEFLVGERSMRYALEDGVLYERHQVPASNLPTFRNMLADEKPKARKFRKLTAEVDGEKLAAARNRSRLSLDELSGIARISRETLYRYEHSLTSATAENIRKLESIFQLSFSKPLSPQKHSQVRTFDFHGLECVRVSSPFEILGRERQKGEKIAFGADCDPRTARKRAGLYSHLSGILEAHFCFIMREHRKDSINEIPVVRRAELEQIEKPRELIKLIKERSS